MAEYVAINKEVEVNKQTVLAFVNSMEKNQDVRLNILKKNGIDPDNSEWINQQAWLNAFKEIHKTFGDMNLFLIGKAIIENAKFPPINSLKEALHSVDVAYHMNHRLNGQIMYGNGTGKMTEGIGHYELLEYNAKEKTAKMLCNNPYPSKFDEGIITQLVRRFKPMGAREQVSLDTSSETRINGGDSDTFIIKW